jgi:hypothetical protein
VRAATQTIKKFVDYEFEMAVAKIMANKQQLTHPRIDANVVEESWEGDGRPRLASLPCLVARRRY